MMESMPEGTRSIVDAAIEDNAQSLFSAADVPLARSEELLKALQGPAMRAVCAMRIEQMVKHGHTAEADEDLPIFALPKKVLNTAQLALAAVGVTEHNIPAARRRLAATAALCLAAIDRIALIGEGGQ